MKKNSETLSGKRILVVDDDEISRLVALEILEGLGAKVLLATGPDEALRLVPENRFDLIMLDLHMPEMHGSELAAHLERLDKSLQTRIVYLTAQENRKDNKTPHAVPRRQVITKPMDPRLILEHFQKIPPHLEQPKQPTPATTIDSIDFSMGIRNFMGQEQAFLATLSMFPEYGRHFIEEYQSNLLAENSKECWRLAHSLKGSSAMIGATGINALAKELEGLCESSHDFESIRSTFEKMRKKILEVSAMVTKQNLKKP